MHTRLRYKVDVVLLKLSNIELLTLKHNYPEDPSISLHMYRRSIIIHEHYMNNRNVSYSYCSEVVLFLLWYYYYVILTSSRCIAGWPARVILCEGPEQKKCPCIWISKCTLSLSSSLNVETFIFCNFVSSFLVKIIV